MSDEDLALKVSSETPWWAKALTASSKASIFFAAGIVGVPSLLAVGGAFFAVSRPLPRDSWWLIVPAALHGGLIIGWLLRRQIARVLENIR